jgi:HK97 family phage major capsid protein
MSYGLPKADSVTDLKARRTRLVEEMQSIMPHLEDHTVTPAMRERFHEIDNRITQLTTAIAAKKNGEKMATKVSRKALKNYERTGNDESFTRYLRSGRTEYRSDGTGFSTAPNDAGLSAGATGYDAGYMIPQGFWMNLQVALKQYGGTSNDFRYVETKTGAPAPWPTIDPTSVTGTWLSGENNQLSVTEPYQFGQGMLNAWTLAVGPFLASLQLVEDSAFDVDQFVAERIGEALGRSIAAIAISGTGSSQPLGVVTALAAKSATGTVGSGSITATGGYLDLATALEVKTFAGTPTELAGNLLSPQTIIGMIQSVDPAYRNDPADGTPLSKFYMNDSQLAGMRSVVDDYGRPLLQDPTHEKGVPSLYGYPVVIDNNIPNLTASTAGGPVFGNLQNAMVFRVVRSDARVVANTGPATQMRLTERYADYLAVGYLGYLRCDIRSNDLRAAVTVKPAAT